MFKDEGGRRKDEVSSRLLTLLHPSSFILHPWMLVPHPHRLSRSSRSLLLSLMENRGSRDAMQIFDGRAFDAVRAGIDATHKTRAPRAGCCRPECSRRLATCTPHPVNSDDYAMLHEANGSRWRAS